jgi:hypothetical protein
MTIAGYKLSGQEYTGINCMASKIPFFRLRLFFDNVVLLIREREQRLEEERQKFNDDKADPDLVGWTFAGLTDQYDLIYKDIWSKFDIDLSYLADERSETESETDSEADFDAACKMYKTFMGMSDGDSEDE